MTYEHLSGPAVMAALGRNRRGVVSRRKGGFIFPSRGVPCRGCSSATPSRGRMGLPSTSRLKIRYGFRVEIAGGVYFENIDQAGLQARVHDVAEYGLDTVFFEFVGRVGQVPDAAPE